MKYSYINEMDIYNGPGVRISFFIQGQYNMYKNNASLNDFNNGKEFDKVVENEIIRLASDKNISGLTITGGEPFDQVSHLINYHSYYTKKFYDLYNDYMDISIDDVEKYYNTLSDNDLFEINPIYHLVKRFKETCGKSIWIYTIYNFNDLLLDKTQDKDIAIGSNICLKYIDVIVNGRYIKDTIDFEKSLKSESITKCIDVKRSLENNDIITYAKEAK